MDNGERESLKDTRVVQKDAKTLCFKFAPLRGKATGGFSFSIISKKIEKRLTWTEVEQG